VRLPSSSFFFWWEQGEINTIAQEKFDYVPQMLQLIELRFFLFFALFSILAQSSCTTFPAVWSIMTLAKYESPSVFKNSTVEVIVHGCRRQPIEQTLVKFLWPLQHPFPLYHELSTTMILKKRRHGSDLIFKQLSPYALNF